jgi:hypothetical protein
VIVVNTDTFLWISGHFGLESGVYGLHKAARKPCMSEELFWDKKAVPKMVCLLTFGTCGYPYALSTAETGELMTLASIFPHPIIQGPTAGASTRRRRLLRCPMLVRWVPGVFFVVAGCHT